MKYEQYAYDDNNNCIAEEVLHSGVKTLFHFDAANRCIEEEKIFSDGITWHTYHEYDEASNKISTTDHMGRTTFYEYDALHRITKIRYPKVVLADGSAHTPTEKTTYTALDSATERVDTTGHTTKYFYTARNTVYSIHYPDGTTERNRYHRNGTLASHINRHGVETSYRYDGLKRVVSITEGDCKKTTITYKGCQKASETDPMGRITRYFYDGAGRLIAEECLDRTTTYTYDELSRKKTIRKYDKDHFQETRFSYDVFDRVTEESIFADSDILLSRTQYVYDILDHVVEEKHFAAENVVLTTKRVFNPRGLLESITDPVGNSTRFEYHYGHKNSLSQHVLKKVTIDPDGVYQIEIFDALDRLIHTERRSSSNILLAKTTFAYDLKGHKTEEIARAISIGVVVREYIISYSYNEMGELLCQSEMAQTPEEKTTRYTYNHGVLSAIVKPNGVAIYHEYDALGRLSRKKSSDTSIDYTYEYDLHDNLVKTIDHTHSLSFQRKFTLFNQLEEDSFGNGQKAFFQYDGLGRIREYQTSTGQKVLYQYKQGVLQKISRYDGFGRELYSHRYLEFSLMQQVLQSSLAGKVGKIAYTYDSNGRLIHAKSSVHELSDFSYDAASNLTNVTITDHLGSLAYTYWYDELRQVVAEEGAFGIDYQNDSLFNRLAKDYEPYTVSPTNRLLSCPEGVFTYDANGNIASLKKAGQTYLFQFDALDRLTTIDIVGKYRVTYLYDMLNRRILKNILYDNPQSIAYIYFDNREVGTFTKNILTEFRVLGLGKQADLGASVAIELNGHFYVPIHDFRANICLLLDMETKKPVLSAQFSAFGETLTEGTIFCPWLFCSKRHETELGTYFFGQRYYLPSIGRFITPDPAGFIDGQNLYAYVHNNPLTLIDPYGLMTMGEAKECGAAAAVETSSGAIHGFMHPIDATYDRFRQISSLGKEYLQGGFPALRERWANASSAQIAGGIGRLSGEIIGTTLSIAPLMPVMRAGASLAARVAIPAAEAAYSRITSLAARSFGSMFKRDLGRETVQAAEALAVSETKAIAKTEWVNLASEERTTHIIEGKELLVRGKKEYSGGHMFPGKEGKTFFPASWEEERIMHHISDLVTDPKIPWIYVENSRGLSRYKVEGIRIDLGETVHIRAIVEPAGEGIISGYPIK